MVFRAQDPSRIVDLDHLIILINSATTTGINRKRVLIDDLWGLIRDLWRLVGRWHELNKGIIEGSLWRGIELGDHLPNRLTKEQQVLLGVFAPYIVHKCPDTLVIILCIDLLELG